MNWYDELSKLHEDRTFEASQRFWLAAKNSQLDDNSFHFAFDNELEELGLMDIFNTDGTLINSGVYSRIKAAKEANPDSWAVKALLKMWVLQFKDKVKPESQIRREKAEAERAEREAKIAAAKAELEAKRAAEYEAAKKEWDILNENLSFVQDLINKTAKEYVAAKKAILKPNLEQELKLKTEIETATQGIVKIYDSSAASILSKLDKEDELIKVSVTLEELDPRYPYAVIRAEVRKFLTESPNFYYWDKSTEQHKTASHTLGFGSEDIKEAIVKSKVVALLNGIWKAVSSKLDNLTRMQKEHKVVMDKINTAKAAQSAVNAGSPVDPEFVSKILDELAQGRKAAKKAYDFYSDTQDGSSGAAAAMQTYETLVSVGTYLVNCNWRATVNGREIASWRTTDSVKDLRDQLETTFDAFSSDLNIEIVE